MIPFEEIDARLDKLGKNRAWLAETSGRPPGSVRAALAPNAVPKQRSKLLQKALSDAIEREESSRGPAVAVVAGVYEIRQDAKQAADTDEASRLVGAKSLADFCLMAITHRANEIIAKRVDPCGFKITPIPEPVKIADPIDNIAEFPASMVADDVKPYTTAAGHWLDLMGGVAAGAQISSDVHAAPIPVLKEYPAGHYALRVFGTSMEPKIPDGSTIVVQSWQEGFPRKGTIVVYSDASGSTLKEFGYRKAAVDEEADAMGNVPVLRSLNQKAKDATTMDGGRIDAVYVETL